MTTAEDKMEKLKKILKGYEGGVALALSGGVDSSLLLSAAADVLGGRITAVTANAGFVPQSEVDQASGIAGLLEVPHEVIQIDFHDIEGFEENPPDRCYLCKRHMLERIIRFAHERGADTVMEASNADDREDFRPGLKAIEELSVKSPLAEAGLTKKEIRDLARKRELPNWDRPPNTCLATRIRTGEEITGEKLERVEKAEEFLHSLGFGLARVRHHGALARIEVAPGEIERLMDNEIRAKIDQRFTELGFMYVTVDMEGYRPGSMNG